MTWKTWYAKSLYDACKGELKGLALAEWLKECQEIDAYYATNGAPLLS